MAQYVLLVPFDKGTHVQLRNWKNVSNLVELVLLKHHHGSFILSFIEKCIA